MGSDRREEGGDRSGGWMKGVGLKRKKEKEMETACVWLSSLSVCSSDVTASLIYCTGVFSWKQCIGGSPIKGNKP